MPTLLETIANTFSHKQAEQAERQANDFTAIVKRIAAGEEVDPVTAADALAEAGKTPQDLEQAVANHRQRMADRAALDAVPGLQKQIADLEAQLNTEWAKVTAARAKYDSFARPKEEQLSALKGQLANAASIPSRLIETAPEHLQARRRKLLAQRGPHQHQIDAHSTHLAQLRASLRNAERQQAELAQSIKAQGGAYLSTGIDPAQIRQRHKEQQAKLAETAKNLQADIAKTEGKISEHRQAIDKIQTEVAKLETEMQVVD